MKKAKDIEKKYVLLQALKEEIISDIEDTINDYLELTNNTIWFDNAKITYYRSLEGGMLPHTILGIIYDEYVDDVRIVERNYRGQYRRSLKDYDFKELVEIVKTIEKIQKK